MASSAPFDIGEFIESGAAWHGGWPYVRGTHKTVASVGVLYTAGLGAGEIAVEKFMTLPQVHAAICYYLANREVIDAEIDADERVAEALAEQCRFALFGLHGSGVC